MAGLTVNPAELREKTNAAIAKGVQRRLEQERLNEEELRRKANEQAAKASIILRALPDKCEAAAEKGESYVVLMKVKNREDYIVPSDRKVRDPDEILGEWLIGAAALVWKACETAGFHPFFKFDYAGDGSDSWHNMTVNW